MRNEVSSSLISHLSSGQRNSHSKMHGLIFLLAPVLVLAAVISFRDSSDDSRAVYFLDNNPAGASIISLKIAEDGTLSHPVRTSTGGQGLLALTAGMNGAPAAAGGAGEMDELPYLGPSNTQQRLSSLKTLL
jgi:hypothetical protein